MLDALEMGAVALDRERKVVYANRRVEEWLGVEPGALLGLPGNRVFPGADARWPNDLARRLDALGGPALSVDDEGIGGNRLLGGSGCCGASAGARFVRDALDQPGVRDVIVLEGINDIGIGMAYPAKEKGVRNQIMTSFDAPAEVLDELAGVAEVRARETMFGGGVIADGKEVVLLLGGESNSSSIRRGSV